MVALTITTVATAVEPRESGFETYARHVHSAGFRRRSWQ